MVEYKLTVVKTRAGKYQVSHYHKIEPTEIQDFPSLINHLLSYSDSETFVLEPIIVDCSQEEETAIRNIRQLILDKGKLESKVGDDIPF